MSWNYRVIKHTNAQIVSFDIREVYYDEHGHPTMTTESACSPEGDTLDELERDLTLFKNALLLPPIDIEAFGQSQVVATS